MKKKYLSMMAMAIIMTATIGLKAQDNPNGVGTGSGNLSTNLWSRVGDQLSGTANKLGSTNNYPIRICTNDTERIYIDGSGSIGINTTSPLQMLHVVEGNILISANTDRAPGSTNGSILFGDQPSSANPYGKWGIEYVGNTDEGYGLNFWKPYNTSGGFMNNVLFLADNGYVGVGTNEPPAKFSVNGKILAKEVHVCTNSTCWPDYVFGDDYKLMTLRELESFVNINKHLPGVPSANEMEEQGSVDLGEMNAILLEKVEELTRYVIDLQKQIDEMKK